MKNSKNPYGFSYGIKNKLRKRVRTISGVAILSIMTKPLPCPGRCVYCPGGIEGNGQHAYGENSRNPVEFSHDTNNQIFSGYGHNISTPKSYVTKSPTVLRAARYDYDSKKQIEARIIALKAIGHIAEKNEVIVMGGTFMSAPVEYREAFIKGIYDGLNGFVSKSLEQSQKANETAEQRCVALCIETRPDWCRQEHIDEMLKYGATRVEIGVQLVDDESYKLTKRGHCVKDVIDATKRLKDAGFKVYYHYMCNLPGSDIENDIKLYDKLFSDPDFRPDGLKIYPCQVVQGTELVELVRQGRHMPYSDNQLIELVARLKLITPRYARIQSIMRALPAECITAGTKCSGLRMNSKDFMKQNNMMCQCIRCREVGYRALAGQKTNPDAIKLNRFDYEASGGKEILLTLDDMDSDALIGLLRLRIPSNPFRSEIANSCSDSQNSHDRNSKIPYRVSNDTNKIALIRELHVYGLQKGILENNNKNSNTNSSFLSEKRHDIDIQLQNGFGCESFQHMGYGKQLLQEAEKIAKGLGFNKIVIISGVGARKYYEKFGYILEGNYMIKNV